MTDHPHTPKFLITIDTEGDNLWSRPRQITTRNASFLPRFQSLCERFGFAPTYLTNYEMATCPVFQDFAHDVLRRGSGEIGMHLHAWNSPPLEPLTPDDLSFQPYLIEYRPDLLREKVVYLTELLQNTFGTPMTSHRAGRWAMNPYYAQVLAECGYLVDCSVTPGVSWQQTPGDPKGNGGTDYRHFPRTAYFMSSTDLSRQAPAGLLQVPMTIHDPAPSLEAWRDKWIVSRLTKRLFPLCWLRPNGSNLDALLALARQAPAAPGGYLEFMLHSSEFMPGGSPLFPTDASIEQLYEHMEQLFSVIAQRFTGATLSGYAQQVIAAAHA